MARKKDKMEWFPLYVYRFVTDVAGWTNRELGAYMRLLFHQWINGYIPNEQRRLSIIACAESPEIFTEIWNAIKGKFILDPDGNLINETLHNIRQEQQGKMDGKSKSGSEGAERRWKRATEINWPYSSEKFKTQWERWKAYKKDEHRFSYKSIDSEQTALNGLKKLSEAKGGQITSGEARAIELIENAIEKGWKGIYEKPAERGIHSIQQPTVVAKAPRPLTDRDKEEIALTKQHHDAAKKAAGEEPKGTFTGLGDMVKKELDKIKPQ